MRNKLISAVITHLEGWKKMDEKIGIGFKRDAIMTKVVIEDAEETLVSHVHTFVRGILPGAVYVKSCVRGLMQTIDKDVFDSLSK